MPSFTQKIRNVFSWHHDSYDFDESNKINKKKVKN